MTRSLYRSIPITALTLCSALACSVTAMADQQTANPIAPLAQPPSDVTALVRRMTLDEKLAQLTRIWFDKARVLDDNSDDTTASVTVKNTGHLEAAQLYIRDQVSSVTARFESSMVLGASL